MGIGTFIIGAIAGAGIVIFVTKPEAFGEIPPIFPPPIVGPIEDSIDIFVESDQISSERWEFQATYRNRVPTELRSRLIFELRDPQNGQVFSQSQDINFDPDSTIQVIWDTLNLSDFSNIEGNFTAIFRVEKLFTGEEFARPFTIVIPITFPSPMILEQVI